LTKSAHFPFGRSFSWAQEAYPHSNPMQGALTQLHHGGFLLKSSAGFPGADELLTPEEPAEGVADRRRFTAQGPGHSATQVPDPSRHALRKILWSDSDEGVYGLTFWLDDRL
jgi:hypothetical protein